MGRSQAQAVLAAMVILFTGCAATPQVDGPPSTTTPPAINSAPPDATMPSAETPTPTTTGPLGTESLMIGGLIANSSHSSIVFRYTLHEDVTNVSVQLMTTEGPAARLLGNISAGSHELRAGFLSSQTQYQYTLNANRGAETETRSGTVTTTGNPHQWATSNILVQPGTLLLGCDFVPGAGEANAGFPYTAAFVLQSWDNETVYVLTAGHCGRPTGTRVTTGGPLGEIGTVVAFDCTLSEQACGAGDGGDGRDWSLIQIDADKRASVSPQLLHFTGPTGVMDPSRMMEGDKVCYYGHGVWPGRVYTPDRCGTFMELRGDPGYGQMHWFKGNVGLGDSGMAVVDYASGRALGLFVSSDTNLPPNDRTEGGGAPLGVLLKKLRELGFDVGLSMAPYSPPP